MRLSLTAALLFLSACQTVAQPDTSAAPSAKFDRRVELSISGSYQNISMPNSSGGSGVFLLSPRFGYFIVQGLEIEPEATLLVPSAGDAAYVLNGNMAYNLKLEGRALLFGLIGYGTANSLPILGLPFGPWKDTKFGVLNLGGGLKVLVTDDVALRVEVRYQRFTGQQELQYGYYDIGVPAVHKEDIDIRITTFQFGFSIFL